MFSLIQPQNILLTSLSPMGDIKIVDFGLARKLGSSGELREILGTPEYVGKAIQCHSFSVHGLIMPEEFMLNESGVFSYFAFFLIIYPAPEILNYEPITTATDLW